MNNLLKPLDIQSKLAILGSDRASATSYLGHFSLYSYIPPEAMKCEVTLIFEENDGTLKWLFNIITYAHHISEPKVQKLLEPMLKEFLHEKSYVRVMKLGAAGISEEELVQIHLNNGLIRFNNPTIKVRGQKIKAMCYMIEQAGAMQAAATSEEVPAYILDLFKGHESILGRMKEVVTEALHNAGAQGITIDKFSSE